MSGNTAQHPIRAATDCPAPGCTAPLGTNGVACSAHWRSHVPPYVQAALFRTKRDAVTNGYVATQARRLVAGLPVNADLR